MKRKLIYMSAFILALSITACKSGDASDSSNSSDSTATEAPVQNTNDSLQGTDATLENDSEGEETVSPNTKRQNASGKTADNDNNKAAEKKVVSSGEVMNNSGDKTKSLDKSGLKKAVETKKAEKDATKKTVNSSSNLNKSKGLKLKSN